MLFVFTRPHCPRGTGTLRTNFHNLFTMYKNRRGIYIPHQKAAKHNVLKRNGGDEEDRTPDLLNANQALSQLSYGPIEENGGPGQT